MSDLLFIHGAGSNADFWHLQSSAFPNAHYVNLPGHGPRTKDDGRKTMDGVGSSIGQYADWVARYVEGRKLDDVTLNGHSMGGAVALELALRQPEWLSGLVLTCAGAHFPVPERLMKLLREDYEAAVDLIIAESFGWHEGTLSYAQKVRREGTRRQMLRTPQAVVLGDYEVCVGFDVTTRLGEIKVPTLIIAGEQDRVTPPSLSRELHQGIVGSRLEAIEGAGHMLPIERPEEYNRILERSLREI